MTTLTIPEKEEMVQIAEEMFHTAVKMTTDSMMKPSGLLLKFHDESTVQFMTGVSSAIMERMGMMHRIRKMMGRDPDSEEEMAFITGVFWGYYNDTDKIESLWGAESMHEESGISKEVSSACVTKVVETVTEMSDGHFGGDGDVMSLTHPWLTGCFVGRYFVGLDEVMNGVE